MRFGEARACVETACNLPDPQAPLAVRITSCKGLGPVEIESAATIRGQAEPTTVGERLVEVR